MIIPSTNHLKQSPELNRPITYLKGIGSKRADLLARKGLNTILDLLFFTPSRYEDRSEILPISKAEVGKTVLIKGKVIFSREERFSKSGKSLFKIMIKDETGSLEFLWFHYKKVHLSRFAVKDLELMAYGNIHRTQSVKQMIHPDIILADQDREKDILGFYPVYPAINGISGRVLSFSIKQALDQYQETLSDAIPRNITSHLGLPKLGEALRGVHFPVKKSSIDLLNQLRTRDHQRLTFDSFFNVMLNMAFRKKTREMRKGIVFSIPEDLVRKFEKCLPFSLTGGQKKAIKEMIDDVSSGKPMNRLLQGDVGCGKTVVAAAVAYVTIFNNYQVAIMVPTQVLAQQHYIYFSSLSEKMGFHPVLLSGRLKKSDRLNAYRKISDGAYNLIIGTQALIQEDLSFNRLGLVVIDEQHRFGVRQRALLDKKGENPHLLVMTATPIPRTIAMTLYADVNMSMIKEYPEGHKPVVTRLVDKSQKMDVFNILKRKMSAGQQAMVICPVIEGAEDVDLKNALEMNVKLKKIFDPPFHIGLVHGRLSADEKMLVMEQFRNKKIDLLVGTTVIEVGVHAPGATVIVIEHPERFGLIQLHQLRGRAGRGTQEGLCLLMKSKKGLPDATLSRLNVLVENNDGFEIAQKDLEMRGQGELMGIRQAGAGELDFSEMFREPELLFAAKREAEKIIDSDPELLRTENHFLREMVQSTFQSPLDF